MVSSGLHIALFQPDIPQNTGTLLRMGACLDVPVHLIEPMGFSLSEQALKRAGMDYIERATLHRHKAWEIFFAAQKAENRRLILLTSKACTPYLEFIFRPCDTLLLGRESSGVPDYVHEAVDEQVVIPMRTETRTLNVALAAAMVLGEAIRQITDFKNKC